MATFNSPTDVTAGSLAKSSDLNNLDAAVAAAFALLPTNANLDAGTVNFAVDTGTANAYLVALPKAPTSYTDGLQVVMRPLYSNTGACTINVDSLGVKSIKNEAGASLVTGDIMAGVPAELRYSTTTGFFHIIKSSVAAADTVAAGAEQLRIWTYTHTVTSGDVAAGHYDYTIAAVTLAKVRSISGCVLDSGDGCVYDPLKGYFGTGPYQLLKISTATNVISSFGMPLGYPPVSIAENDVISLTIIEAV